MTPNNKTSKPRNLLLFPREFTQTMTAFTSPPDEGFSEYPMESQNIPESTVAVRDLPSYIAQMSVQDRARMNILWPL